MRFRILFVYSLCLCAGTTSEACVRSSSQRAADMSNLRQIGMASIIYASDNNERLPEANDVWDYARLLALRGGLETTVVWQSRVDPAYNQNIGKHVLGNVDTKGNQDIAPEFLKLKPAYAVALGKIRLSSPSTTPIAWTRGLQSDGTWAKHSPYGEAGGYVLFVSGQIAFYPNLQAGGGELITYRDGRRTSNILEALPNGTRISEYTPTADEQAAWSEAKRVFSTPYQKGPDSKLTLAAVIFLPFIIIAIMRAFLGRPLTFGLLGWPVFLCAIAWIIIPTVC